LPFFIWPLRCLSFDLRILITPFAYLQTLHSVGYIQASAFRNTKHFFF
jgi:hypothetical protein